MKTAFCPISDKKINENIARSNAFLTVIFLIFFVLTSNPLVIAFLLFDFLLRSLELSGYSPFTVLSKNINRIFKIKPVIINAGPKIFAARIGLTFSVLILTASLAGWGVAAYVLTAIFGVCALLEATIGFCLACEIYPFVYRLLYKPEAIR